MECVGCGSAAVSERSERTAQDYRRFRCRVCGKQFNERSAGSLNRTQYPSDVIAPVVLWRLRYKLALRDLPEMFLIRGIVFSHEAVRDWEAKLTPALAESLRRRRRGKAGPSWYVDETYIKVHGHWRYLYRAIDRSGALVDVMFSEHRDMAAAKAFFESAKMVTGVTPDRVTTDGHDSYPRAIRTTLGAGLHLSHVPGIRARVTCARSRSGCPRRPAGTPGVVGGLPRHTAANPSIYLPPASSCRRTAPIPRRPLSDTSSRFQPCLVGATAAGNRAGCTRDRYGDRVDHSTWANNSALVPAHVSTNGSAVRIVRPDHTGSSPYTDSVDNVHQLDNTAAHQWVGPDGRAAGMTGSTPPPGVAGSS
jgi:transposase-like protein